MSSTKRKPSLVVLDVGHGSAAVLHDEGGVVVIDTGKGAHVDRHLGEIGQREVEAMFLSHADLDHIGGAVTLLLNPKIKVRAIFLNPDPSKDTDVFMQLRVALCDSEKRSGTRIEPSLTTSTVVARRGAKIEVLHPPATAALAGVGGRHSSGKRNTSNSLSAAIRVSTSLSASILLGGDVERDCVDEWKRTGMAPSANVLVFPHHGGLPGTSDKSEAALFAFELAQMIKPEVVIFSNHRTKFENPRDEVLAAISKAAKGIRFACTQLPNRLRTLVHKSKLWSLHKPSVRNSVVEGAICLKFQAKSIRLSFVAAP